MSSDNSSDNNNAPNNLMTTEYTLATLTLGVVLFTHGYLVGNVAPYSGYMALHLLVNITNNNNNHHPIVTTTETVGFYAGWMGSAMELGRTISALCVWDKVARTYGRVALLMISLQLSCVCSVFFGMTQHWGTALLWRFLLGLSNGLMEPAKTLMVEIATGDKNLECHGMRNILRMWEWSLVMGPIIAGSVVLPLQQYPDYWNRHQYLQEPHHSNYQQPTTISQSLYDDNDQQSTLMTNPLYQFLETKPFVLASWIGAMLCLWSLFLLNAFVSDPLPQFRFRDPRHIPRDIFTRLKSMLSTIQERADDEDTTYSLISERANSEYGSIPSLRQQTSSFASLPPSPFTSKDRTAVTSPQIMNSNIRNHTSTEIHNISESEMDDAIRISELAYAEDTALLSIVDDRSVLVRFMELSNTHWEGQRIVHVEENIEDKKHSTSIEETTGEAVDGGNEDVEFSRLWQKPATRHHMIVYWLSSFFLRSIDEVIPLFLLSQAGGLGLSPKAIGFVLGSSCLINIFSERIVYAKSVTIFGFYGSISMSLFLSGAAIVLVPLVLFAPVNDSATPLSHSEGTPFGDLTLTALVLLAIILSVHRSLASAAMSSILVGLNQTIEPKYRHAMNRWSNTGGNIAKIIAPTVSASMIAGSFSLLGINHNGLGSVIAFSFLSVFGLLNAMVSTKLLKGIEYNGS